jgi:hypothetical protein
VEFSSIISVIALLVTLLSAWYTRHAARAAKAQADAAKQQAAAAKAQLSLDQERRNDELARRRKEEEEAARADLRVTTIWVRPHPPQIVPTQPRTPRGERNLTELSRRGRRPPAARHVALA